MFKELKEAFGFYADAPNGQKTDMKLTEAYEIEALIQMSHTEGLELQNVPTEISISHQNKDGCNLLHTAISPFANNQALQSFIFIARDRGELELALSQKDNLGSTPLDMVNENLELFSKLESNPEIIKQNKGLVFAKEILENATEHLKMRNRHVQVVKQRGIRNV